MMEWWVELDDKTVVSHKALRYRDFACLSRGVVRAGGQSHCYTVDWSARSSDKSWGEESGCRRFSFFNRIIGGLRGKYDL